MADLVLLSLVTNSSVICNIGCLHHVAPTFSNISSLRKHAYSNILKRLRPKNENFQINNSEIFHISAQNIDCGYLLEPPRRGGSNEYP